MNADHTQRPAFSPLPPSPRLSLTLLYAAMILRTAWKSGIGNYPLLKTLNIQHLAEKNSDREKAWRFVRLLAHCQLTHSEPEIVEGVLVDNIQLPH